MGDRGLWGHKEGGGILPYLDLRLWEGTETSDYIKLDLEPERKKQYFFYNKVNQTLNVLIVFLYPGSLLQTEVLTPPPPPSSKWNKIISFNALIYKKKQIF